MAAMRFEQVQRFILAKKTFWGCRHFKEPTHYSRGVGDEVPGVVAVLCVYMGGLV